MQNIPEFSVSEITNLTKKILEENFTLIRVRGEISKVKEFNKHLYFSIKDQNYVLNSVCWSRNVDFLNIKPEEGMEVCAQGKLTTYAKGSISNYQLQVEQIDIQGEGALLKIFELRKKKLMEEGLFDTKFKKKLPFLPTKIGIITSSAGAVIMDIIDRVKKRFPMHLELYPVSVQGLKSANEIVLGLNYFNQYTKVDLVIIARGGGGVEDFMPFNDENLVRAVFKSKIPVVSAIGHETDFTLLDFVADVRAATPTAAAEIAVPDINNLRKEIKEIFKNLKFTIEIIFKDANEKMRDLTKFLNIASLKNFIKNSNNSVSIVTKNLNFFLKNQLKQKKLEVVNFSIRLENLSVKKVLKRGFAIIKDVKSKSILKYKILKTNQLIDIEFHNGNVAAKTIKSHE